MTNTNISSNMKCLINRVQQQAFLIDAEKQTLLKTLALAEKYLKQENEKEQNVTATTQNHQEEHEKQKHNKKLANQTHENRVAKRKYVEELLNRSQAKISFQQQQRQAQQAALIDFQYFFATLDNHPSEGNLKANQRNWENDEQSLSLAYQKRANQRKKGMNDIEWRRFRKNDFESENNIRRKSLRIEQIQYKCRLEAQMEELRFYFNCAKYRYDDLFVRLRVSYLEANCDKYQEYEIKAATIPQYKLESSTSANAVRKIVESKRESLLKRMLKQT